MAINKDVPTITNLEDYLKLNCRSQKVSVEEVERYAQKGKQFLAAVLSDNSDSTQFPSKNKSDNVAFLHWYLITESFKQKRPFSKGTFNLEGMDDEATLRLYDYLKGTNPKEDNSSSFKIIKQFVKGISRKSTLNRENSYSRGSTHYTDQLANPTDGNFGIDKTTIPLAWEFATHVFGLCKNRDNSLSVYFKPETASADLNKTYESIQHGINLARYLIKREKIKGMPESFRENALSNKTKQFVLEGLKKEGLLNDRIKNRLDECNNMTELAALLSESKSTLNLKQHLIDQYGSTNQVGSEQRMKITNEGALIRPCDAALSANANVFSITKQDDLIVTKKEAVNHSRFMDSKYAIHAAHQNQAIHSHDEIRIKPKQDVSLISKSKDSTCKYKEILHAYPIGEEKNKISARESANEQYVSCAKKTNL